MVKLWSPGVGVQGVCRGAEGNEIQTLSCSYPQRLEEGLEVRVCRVPTKGIKRMVSTGTNIQTDCFCGQTLTVQLYSPTRN